MRQEQHCNKFLWNFVLAKLCIFTKFSIDIYWCTCQYGGVLCLNMKNTGRKYCRHCVALSKWSIIMTNNTGLIDFPDKWAPTIVKSYLLPVFHMLWNSTKGNARKFTVSFALCAHVEITKYWNKLFPSNVHRLLEPLSSECVQS